MNGPPQKPTSALSAGSSERIRRIASSVASGNVIECRRSMSAATRNGCSTTGPTPSTSCTSTPIASTGVMMSAKSTAASTP